MANYQLIWGAVLMLTGVGVLYRIPEVINKIKVLGPFSGNGIYFAYFSFYFLAIFLIGGGIKKIYTNINRIKKK